MWERGPMSNQMRGVLIILATPLMFLILVFTGNHQREKQMERQAHYGESCHMEQYDVDSIVLSGRTSNEITLFKSGQKVWHKNYSKQSILLDGVFDVMLCGTDRFNQTSTIIRIKVKNEGATSD